MANAIQNLDGHVSRAIDFYNHTDFWLCLAHPFDWNIARLTGLNKGNFLPTSTYTFSFKVNGFGPITHSFVNGISQTAASIASALNIAAALVDPSLSGCVSFPANRIRITAPAITDASVEIVSGSPDLGFLTGETITATLGGEDVPPAVATTRRLIEPFAFKKIQTKNLVVPDPDLAAILIGTVRGTTYDTRVSSGKNTLAFKVNGSSTINVTFPDQQFTPSHGSPNSVVERINAAATLVSPLFSNVASPDYSTSPVGIRLTSPTKGAGASIQITGANTGIGFTVGVTSGVDGGAIAFRLDQFRTVNLIDAYDEVARLVYISSTFKYDELPILPYAQIGVVSQLVPKAGYEVATALTLDQVDTFGILEFSDNRQMTPRSVDQKEVVELVVEF